MWGSLASSDRGQSEVLGAALLFGIVLSISVAVVLGGMTVLEQSHAQTSMQSAQVSMSELDTEIREARNPAAAGGGAGPPPRDGASFDGFSDEGELAVQDEGELRIEISRGGSPPFTDSVDLGKIVYRRDGQRLAYQGGGIWRQTGDADASVMVSPPNIEYRDSPDSTLTIPIVRITGSATSEDLSIQQRGETNDVFPASGSDTNPLSGEHEVTITIQSDYYRAWGDVLEERVGGDVSYDPSNREVSARLEGEETPSEEEIGPIGALEAKRLDGSEVSLNNNVEVASYDSDASENPSANPSSASSATRVTVKGDYRHNNGATINGHLFVDGDFNATKSQSESHVTVDNTTTIGGSAEIQGARRFSNNVSVQGDLDAQGKNPAKKVIFEENVYVGGKVLENKDDGGSSTFRYVHIQGDLHVQEEIDIGDYPVTVDGTIYAGDSYTIDSGVTYGALETTDVVSPNDPEEGFTEHSMDVSTIQSKSSYSDSDSNISDIEATTQTVCGCTLESGNYSLDQLHLDDEQLELDTTDGPINIYVRDEIYLGDNVGSNDDTELRITGDNRVNIYNNGDMNIDSAASVVTRSPPRNGTQLWLYQHPGHTVSFAEDATFTGVIYAPGSSGSTGAKIVIPNDVTIYGAVVGDPRSSGGGISNDAKIFYDEALKDDLGPFPQPGDPAPSEVRFIHITDRRVHVGG